MDGDAKFHNDETRYKLESLHGGWSEQSTDNCSQPICHLASKPTSANEALEAYLRGTIWSFFDQTDTNGKMSAWGVTCMRPHFTCDEPPVASISIHTQCMVPLLEANTSVAERCVCLFNLTATVCTRLWKFCVIEMFITSIVNLIVLFPQILHELMVRTQAYPPTSVTNTLMMYILACAMGRSGGRS